MGQLIDGEWYDHWYDTKKTGGKFKREASQFRHWLGEGDFQAQSGRYHLYVSYACPWAHRAIIFRKLKGLDEHISMSVVHPDMFENGWELKGNDPLYGSGFLYQIYLKADHKYTGRVTVPILWDKETETIVSNESSEIIRMLNSSFDAITGNQMDFYPKELRSEIDAINDVIYPNINNGVYGAGFATTQEAYEEAFDLLFETLDLIDERLSGSRYLVGTKITEADWRLFTTLIRFDAVYVGHFKCNKKRIDDYPNLSNYLRELYQIEGVADTVHFDHIKGHYYRSHPTINPTRIVPKGPDLDFLKAHNRSSKG